MRAFIAIAAFAMLMTTSSLYAQRGPHRDRGPEADRSWIQETGLKPSFPPGYHCPTITSPFAARYDGAGNMRDSAIHGGKHGGVDVGLKVGHPLLAIMAGEVISKGPSEGTGAQMEGIYLWLRHSPVESGLPFWTFTKYQHLNKLPELGVGEHVRAGQIIAEGGDTGTYSKKFGISLPHLHMSTYINNDGRYKLFGKNNNLVGSPGALHVDMMILFIPGITMEMAHENPTHSGTEKDIPVAVSDTTGSLSDTSAKIVWPVACRR